MVADGPEGTERKSINGGDMDELKKIIDKQAARIKELEDAQLGQQVADEKVKYAQAALKRAEANDLLTRASWRDLQGFVEIAIRELQKHDCHPGCDGVPEMTLGILKIACLAPPKPIYTAVFLDEPSMAALLQAFPPIHPKVHAHHVTLVFRPSPKDLVAIDPHLEHGVAIEVVGHAVDERGQAVKVSVPAHLRLDDQVHHITMSCAEGISPVYSNELLKKGWIDTPSLKLKGVVRHFTK